MDVDVEQRDVVLASSSLAGSDQFSTAVSLADVEDLDFFADDGAGAWEVPVLVEGGLEACELLVFVVAVDGDLVDQGVELWIGLAGCAQELIVSSSSWRASIASAIAVRCGSSAPAAI